MHSNFLLGIYASSLLMWLDGTVLGHEFFVVLLPNKNNTHPDYVFINTTIHSLLVLIHHSHCMTNTRSFHEGKILCKETRSWKLLVKSHTSSILVYAPYFAAHFAVLCFQRHMYDFAGRKMELLRTAKKLATFAMYL